MAHQTQDAYICLAVRTPIGKAPRGMFHRTRPDDLLAHCLKSLLAKAPQIDPLQIGDVVIGCAMPEAEQGMNVARLSLLMAGLPYQVPGMTINRFCASGLEAVAIAAHRVMIGQADLMIAGGTESMSLIPMMGHRVVINPGLYDDGNLSALFSMGITAEIVAKAWKITREEQDAFAFRSHQRAIKAIEQNEFKDEIMPYTVRSDTAVEDQGIQTTTTECSIDEGPRKDTTVEALLKLRPVFSKDGSVTAGNSSQMSDGAGAVLIANEAAIKKYQLTPIARFVSFAVAGVPPERMGIGPKFAVPKALEKAGLNLNQIDWIELNEAFAAQSLAVIKDLGLDETKVNPLGGAIASGHPLGATGAIKTATLTHGLKRKNLKYGMVTMCIGTGMGACGIFESV